MVVVPSKPTEVIVVVESTAVVVKVETVTSVVVEVAVVACVDAESELSLLLWLLCTLCEDPAEDEVDC